jgi:hypothetical protein
LRETIWLTIVVGSTGEVGSWFFISVTRRLINVVCRLPAEVPVPLLDELLEVLPDVAALALGECTGAKIEGVTP